MDGVTKKKNELSLVLLFADNVVLVERYLEHVDDVLEEREYESVA